MYPYPVLEQHGYQLGLVEQGDMRRVLAAPLPPDEERFAAEPGDTVKLIFEYQKPDRRANGAIVGAEHMWVKVEECGETCIAGRLDDSPLHTKLLKSDDIVYFHPKHIVAFYRRP